MGKRLLALLLAAVMCLQWTAGAAAAAPAAVDGTGPAAVEASGEQQGTDLPATEETAAEAAIPATAETPATAESAATAETPVTEETTATVETPVTAQMPTAAETDDFESRGGGIAATGRRGRAHQ